MIELDGHRDPGTERLLAKYEITAELEWLALDQIDWTRSTARQIRSTTLDESVVERYAAALRAGAIFPAVIALPDEQGAVELLAGLHRAKAHETTETYKIAAYVITTHVDDRHAYLVSVEDNATHGFPLTNDERARHAVRLVEEHGYTLRQAAGQVGLSANMVERALAVAAYAERAHRYGIAKKPTQAIPLTGQWRLQQSTARLDDIVFIEAVQTARNTLAGFKGCSEIAVLITSANGDEATALQLLEDYELDHSPDGTRSPGGRTRPAVALRGAARGFLEVDVDAALESILPADRKLTLELITRVGTRASQYARRLTALMEGRV